MSDTQIQPTPVDPRGPNDDEAELIAEACDARAADTIAMTESIEGMDATDVSMICSKEIDRQVYDWGFVSTVDLAVDPDSIKYVPTADGHDITMTAGIEIVFKDQGTIEHAVVVTGTRTSDGGLGFRSMDVITG